MLVDPDGADKKKKKTFKWRCAPFFPRPMTGLITQINHEVLIYLSFSLEAGGKQEHTVVNGKQGKCTRRLDIQLLGWDKLGPLGVPLVDLCQ